MIADCAPSAANFLLTRHPRRKGESLYHALKARDVPVCHFDHPRISDHLRITIGSRTENDAVVDALHIILESVS